MAALGVCGAVLQAVFGTGRERTFAAGTALTIALVLTLGIVQVFVSLPGPPAIYYELVPWAVYAIFAITTLGVM